MAKDFQIDDTNVGVGSTGNNPIEVAEESDTYRKGSHSSIHDDEDYGLTDSEIADVDSIRVTISDPSPIVILFGAKTSGKTMTLVRLTRYLRDKGYTVEPDRVFRSANAAKYQEMCDQFDNTIYNDNAADGTNIIGFMLVTVRDKNGRLVCQILEAPGEHYFDEQNSTLNFPWYINQIRTIKNKRVWMFIVESNWKDQNTRSKYANKIVAMQSQIKSTDKIIFTCHKADKMSALFKKGRPLVKQFFNTIKNQYTGIFDKYRNDTPILSFFKPWNFEFVVFSSGIFNQRSDGGQSYTPSEDYYPAKLWEAILKSVNGGWA